MPGRACRPRHLQRLPPNPQRGAHGICEVGLPVGLLSPDGSVLAGHDGHLFLVGGSIIAHGTTGRVDEIITAEVRPDLVREARARAARPAGFALLYAHRGQPGCRLHTLTGT